MKGCKEWVYSPFRSNQDGTCQSWYDGDVDHQRYHVHQDVFCVYLEGSQVFPYYQINFYISIQTEFNECWMLCILPMRPWPWLTWPRSFLVFFLCVDCWSEEKEFIYATQKYWYVYESLRMLFFTEVMFKCECKIARLEIFTASIPLFTSEGK